MKINIKKSKLLKPLEKVQGVAESRASIPVLSNILIEANGKNGSLELTSSDLDTTIRTRTNQVRIADPGAVCVEAKKIYNIIRLLPDNDEILIESSENFWATLVCGQSRFRLAGVNPGIFPEKMQLPAETQVVKFPHEMFRQLIWQTGFAITSEQSRFTLSGAKFMITDGTARMITTDGHRLALAKCCIEDVDPKILIDVLIPKKALSQITKLDENQAISFSTDDNHLVFADELTTIIARKLSGSFPDYEKAIPRENTKKLEFGGEQLLAAIGRVALMADERTRSVRLLLSENKIKVSANSGDGGEASEEMIAGYNNENIEIGFNEKYLREFLQICTKQSDDKENKIIAEFKNSTEQILFSQKNKRDYLYIIVPLRI